ncbi:MAG: RNA methyltransferase [Thermoanaerobaculia bacterium]|nr:RNA methyltransferase [Thermoanaerobaculia bacterium]
MDSDASTPPAVILVEPQLAENVGACARAMLNCGLTDLRLVAPRDGWPDEAARPMASGADQVLDGARAYDTLDEATEDLQALYATTARVRDMVHRQITPRRLARELREHESRGTRCGILFGRERIGLVNDEVVRCDAVVVAPLNPEFTSLNLAQAVLLIAWEWRQAGDDTPERVFVEADSHRASGREQQIFVERLEKSLDETGFFRTEHMRDVTWRKVLSLFTRAELTDLDVRVLHGILSALEGKRMPR